MARLFSLSIALAAACYSPFNPLSYIEARLCKKAQAPNEEISTNVGGMKRATGGMKRSPTFNYKTFMVEEAEGERLQINKLNKRKTTSTTSSITLGSSASADGDNCSNSRGGKRQRRTKLSRSNCIVDYTTGSQDSPAYMERLAKWVEEQKQKKEQQKKEVQTLESVIIKRHHVSEKEKTTGQITPGRDVRQKFQTPKPQLSQISPQVTPASRPQPGLLHKARFVYNSPAVEQKDSTTRTIADSAKILQKNGSFAVYSQPSQEYEEYSASQQHDEFFLDLEAGDSSITSAENNGTNRNIWQEMLENEQVEAAAAEAADDTTNTTAVAPATTAGLGFDPNGAGESQIFSLDPDGDVPQSPVARPAGGAVESQVFSDDDI